MYRLRILASIVIIASLALAAVHLLNLSLDPDYYARSFSRILIGLQNEFGNAGLAAIIFAVGVFGFILIQRRT